ncbi:MAG TPA: PEP-CTERM sorting domain-containing protein [Chthoniobacterales bacterium]
MAVAQVHADTTTVSMDSGGFQLFNQASTLLNGGTAADGDGAVLQLGYFTGANFTGSFIALTGEGSLNTGTIPDASPAETMNKTSIGDLTNQGGANGEFWLPELDFVSGSLTSGNNLPANNTQLAIRIYNGTTIASSTFYNTVTDSLWKWVTPATPPTVATLSLADSGLVWESIVRGMNANTAFHTSIATAIPEPTTITSMLIGAGLLCGAIIRRRRS